MIAHTPDNRQIYYHTTGAGPDLLMLHGAMPDYFDPLVEVLSPQFRCIALDRLGYRKSTHLDRNTTVEEQAAAIAAVHQSITSEPIWVFGWSSGGNFALAYALSFPERVRGLILVEPALYAIYPPEQKPPEVDHMENVAMPLFRQGKPEEGWHAFVESIYGPQPRPGDRPPMTEKQLEQVRAFGYDQPVVITWCPSAAELQPLTQPVLILEGDNSPMLLRDMCYLLAQRMVNATVVTLEGQDHGMPYAAPGLVGEQVAAFISECETKT